MTADGHAARLAALAAAQRQNASDLLTAARDASAAGMTWQAIGDALGIPKEEEQS